MIQKFKSSRAQVGLLLFVLLGVFALMGGFTYLFYPPASIHYIRQTDTISFIQNFYQYGLSFWNPEEYNLASYNGKGASEFPLFYWLIAKLWTIVGEKEWILRFWNFSIVVVGLLGFFLFLRRELSERYLAWFILFLTFAGGVFWYYASNFLPDAAGLGFVLLGFYFLTKSGISKRDGLLAVLFLSLCGLMKPTMLVLPIAYVSARLMIDLWNYRINRRLEKEVIRKVIVLFLALVISGIWIVYVKWYNAQVNNIYFLFEPRPYWLFPPEVRTEVWTRLTSKWVLRQYANDQLWQIWTIALFGSLALSWKIERKWWLTNVLSIFGSVCFFVLFFEQFNYHDYYFLAILPTLGFSLFCFVQGIFALSKRKFIKPFLMLLFGLIILLNFTDANKELKYRYGNTEDLYAKVEPSLKGVHLILDSLQISRDSRLVLLGDYSMNGGLRLTKRKGWVAAEFNESTAKMINDIRGFGSTHMVNLLYETVDSGQFGKVVYKEKRFEIVEFD